MMPFVLLCCMVSTVSADTFGLFTYTNNGTSITITDYPTTEVGSVEIPPSIAGKPVTSIGTYAFHGCTGLTSIYFLGHAPALGANVFWGAGAGFKVYYLNGKAGFTSPIWNGYPAVNLGNLSPASVWLHSNGFPADTDLQTDPNGDGVNLMLAYTLNLDPLQNLSGSMLRPVVEGNQMSLTFYAGSEGVTYAAEFSDDLQTWSVVDLPAPDGNNCRTATVPMTGPRRFVRLVVRYFP
jgi:hypothetical protein